MTPVVFRFRFQKILDVKERQERALEIELAGVDRLIYEREAVRAAWGRTREETLAGIARARERADLLENARGEAYLRFVRARLEQCRRAIAELRATREQVRQELQRVMRSRELLEKYRDRLRAEFLVEQEKAEERVTEVHSGLKFIRAEGMP